MKRKNGNKAGRPNEVERILFRTFSSNTHVTIIKLTRVGT